MKHFVVAALIGIITLSATAQSPLWKGTITYTYGTELKSFSFAGKTNKTILPDGSEPAAGSANEIVFINQKFLKRGVLVKTFAGGQSKEVLDLSAENPEYKKALDDYSVIRRTGISGIMSHMGDPKLSPDGKYVSVTIIGAYQNAFTSDCVAVFDVATKKLVKKFDKKYYGTWTPDGRLLMCGTHKRGSVNEPLYETKEPGIFLSDKSLNTLTRIDPELNDPSPYHATVSPDGKLIAYVINNHVWVMDINGKNNRQLTDVDRDNMETYPVFSPDGKFIACWTYKTFERSFFTALAVVDVSVKKPVALTDKAPVWPRNATGNRISGGSHQLTWTR